MIRTRAVVAGATVGLLGALWAGCSGAQPVPTPSPTSTTSTSPATSTSRTPDPTGATAPASTSAAAAGAGNPDRCTTPELRGSLGPADGAAGSVNQTLLLTNTSNRTCELRGFPGVSYVAGADGHQVGPAADMDGEAGGEVRLAPGEAAKTELKLVDVANYDAPVCQPTPVTGLRVYPPGDTGSLFVARAGTGCAGTPPGSQIGVRTLTLS